jgi:hypothetical protein
MKEFWDIDIYYNSGIIEKGFYSFNKLYAKTITIKDVEKFLKTKLRRCGKNESPEVICSAWAEKDGDNLIDYRKERGRKKFYKLNLKSNETNQ